MRNPGFFLKKRHDGRKKQNRKAPLSALRVLRKRSNPLAPRGGAGLRLTQAGWVAMRENTAARRERTARLGYYPLVSREKRLNPQYLTGCETFCRNAGGHRVVSLCLDYERRGQAHFFKEDRQRFAVFDALFVPIFAETET